MCFLRRLPELVFRARPSVSEIGSAAGMSFISATLTDIFFYSLVVSLTFGKAMVVGESAASRCETKTLRRWLAPITGAL